MRFRKRGGTTLKMNQSTRENTKIIESPSPTEEEVTDLGKIIIKLDTQNSNAIRTLFNHYTFLRKASLFPDISLPNSAPLLSELNHKIQRDPYHTSTPVYNSENISKSQEVDKIRKKTIIYVSSILDIFYRSIQCRVKLGSCNPEYNLEVNMGVMSHSLLLYQAVMSSDYESNEYNDLFLLTMDLNTNKNYTATFDSYRKKMRGILGEKLLSWIAAHVSSINESTECLNVQFNDLRESFIHYLSYTEFNGMKIKVATEKKYIAKVALDLVRSYICDFWIDYYKEKHETEMFERWNTLKRDVSTMFPLYEWGEPDEPVDPDKPPDPDDKKREITVTDQQFAEQLCILAETRIRDSKLLIERMNEVKPEYQSNFQMPVVSAVSKNLMLPPPPPSQGTQIPSQGTQIPPQGTQIPSQGTAKTLPVPLRNMKEGLFTSAQKQILLRTLEHPPRIQKISPLLIKEVYNILIKFTLRTTHNKRFVYHIDDVHNLLVHKFGNYYYQGIEGIFILFDEMILRNKKIIKHKLNKPNTYTHIYKPYNDLRKVDVIDELSTLIRRSEAEILFKIPLLISMIFMSMYQTLGGSYDIMENAKGWGEFDQQFLRELDGQSQSNPPIESLKAILDYLDMTPSKLFPSKKSVS
jgi:hypothetical protein